MNNQSKPSERTDSRLECLQVWGGNGAANTTVSTAGLDVWLYSKPFGDDSSGGDVYYLSSCSSGRITRCALVDVCGHGRPVAELATRLRKLMQRHIDHIDQDRLVRSVNREFVSLGDARTFATGIIATFFIPTSALTLTNAGPPPPLRYDIQEGMWRNIETPQVEATPSNIPLGVFDSAGFSQNRLSLRTGDLVLCFTDGLYEAVGADGEMLGSDGLRRLLDQIGPTEPQQLISALVKRVKALSPQNLSEDDVSILLLRPHGETVPLRNTVLAPVRYLAKRFRKAPTSVELPNGPSLRQGDEV